MDLIMRNYIHGEDYGEVYRLFTDPKINQLIANKYDHNSMNIFSKWLENKLSHEFNDFAVFRTIDNDFIGFAYTYDFQPLNGHCLFSLAIKEEYQNIGIGAVATINFIDNLFKNYNLRKIYTHIYTTNQRSINCLEKFGFLLEGNLKNYSFCNGKFVDLRIYSIEREEFFSTLDNI